MVAVLRLTRRSCLRALVLTVIPGEHQASAILLVKRVSTATLVRGSLNERAAFVFAIRPHQTNRQSAIASKASQARHHRQGITGKTSPVRHRTVRKLPRCRMRLFRHRLQQSISPDELMLEHCGASLWPLLAGCSNTRLTV